MGLFAPFAGFRRVAPEHFGPFTLLLVEIPARSAGKFYRRLMCGLCQVLQAGAGPVGLRHAWAN